MDKNTITGFILITLVIIGFSWYSQPSEAELQEMARQDSIRQVEQQILPATTDATQTSMQATADSSALFFAHRTGTPSNVMLKNELIEVEVSTLGAMVKNAKVISGSGIKDNDAVQVLDDSNQLYFMWSGKEENIDTRNYYFTPVSQTEQSVTMRLAHTDATQLDIVYTLRPHSYMLDIEIKTHGMGKYLSPQANTLHMNWEKDAIQLEKGFDFENRYSSLTYKLKNDGVENLSEMSEEHEEVEKPVDWIAFKNQFFSCILIGHQDFTQTSLSSVPNKMDETPVRYQSSMKHYAASAQTTFDPQGAQSVQMQMYIGPNDFQILQEANEQGSVKKDLQLEDIIYFGWPIFKWINRFFILYLFDWLNGWGLPMGIVLLLLTIIVKILVFPTTKKSYISSAKMRVLKPQVDALSQKYPKPEDAMKKQQEMMQLYSQYGVSPMGGCLPMLIQTPFWIALFNFVPNAIALRGESFLWADDLSAYDDLIRWDANLWLIGDHLSIFCLLFCLTNVVNTIISMRQQQTQMSSEQAQQMKLMQYMMYVMPIAFFFMFNNYSSGLCYYYFLSGLISVLIMWYLRRTTDDAKLLAKLEAYRAEHKNDAKKTSGMAARLAALQKMQEEQMRNKK